jgi:hypothetical protein
VATALCWARDSQGGPAANPFAYEVDRFAKTDPKLIAYEEFAKFPAGVAEPRRIEAAQGQIYIAGKTGVVVLNGSGSRVSELPLSAAARALAVAGDGSLYVAVRERIEVFDRDGQSRSKWESPGKKAWLTGLTISEQELFAADSANRVVLRYDRSGKLLGRIGEKSKERNVHGLIVPSPYLDVALGKDGLLRVNNPGRHCVDLYTTSGELELSWGKASAAIEGFCGCCNPVGLTMLPDGRCVTSEKGLPRVKVYSAEGVFESVVAGPESFPANAKSGSVHDLSDGSMGGLDTAADAQGRIYILDLVTGDVRVMQRKAKA